MEAAVVIIYLALCISAPWIARKWGAKGSWGWFLITIGFLVSTVMILGDV